MTTDSSRLPVRANGLNWLPDIMLSPYLSFWGKILQNRRWWLPWQPWQLWNLRTGRSGGVDVSEAGLWGREWGVGALGVCALEREEISLCTERRRSLLNMTNGLSEQKNSPIARFVMSTVLHRAWHSTTTQWIFSCYLYNTWCIVGNWNTIFKYWCINASELSSMPY